MCNKKELGLINLNNDFLKFQILFKKFKDDKSSL